MSYEFTVRVETAKTAGPFASRDDIETELVEALEQADPGSVSPGDSEYEVIDWTIEAGAPEKVAKKSASKDREFLETIHQMLGSAPTLKEDDFLSRIHAALGRHLMAR